MHKPTRLQLQAKSLTKKCLSLASSLVIVSGLLPVLPRAVAVSSAPAGRVSFTFDDGLSSAISDAAPTLARYGFSGTNYVITSCVGMTTAPNTCNADQDDTYMTWEQLTTLKNTYGWEIGSHTVSHPLLASSDPEFQPTPLTQSQVVQELANSKSTLAAHGFNATSFASPYGDYTIAQTLPEIAKLYNSHRGFADVGYNAFPSNDYLLYNQQVQAGVSVATVKSYIDTARANNQWLILTFHDIKANASTSPDEYEYKTSDLDQIAAYVKSLNMPVVNIEQGRTGSANNMFVNGGFDLPISSNLADVGSWTTDDPTNIKQNSANNGSMPSSTNSVELNGTTKNIELFSPRVTVDATKTYAVKNYLKVSTISVAAGHEIAFYMDEYDANGTYLSTQYKKSEPTAWVEIIGFEYKPSSANVKSARMQVVVTANSGVKAYLDNAQMFAEDGTVTGGQGAGGKAGDINNDNAINALDLSIMLTNWNKSGVTRAQGDLSGDAKVNALDLSILLTNWGK